MRTSAWRGRRGDKGSHNPRPLPRSRGGARGRARPGQVAGRGISLPVPHMRVAACNMQAQCRAGSQSIPAEGVLGGCPARSLHDGMRREPSTMHANRRRERQSRRGATPCIVRSLPPAVFSLCSNHTRNRNEMSIKEINRRQCRASKILTPVNRFTGPAPAVMAELASVRGGLWCSFLDFSVPVRRTSLGSSCSPISCFSSAARSASPRRSARSLHGIARPRWPRTRSRTPCSCDTVCWSLSRALGVRLRDRGAQSALGMTKSTMARRY